ncbi:MAG: hypothetical protein H0X46_01140 [Bacteroidetes bacterium]|nr:hypothetical protein [Bacteroidota bacterium]
MNYTLEEVIRPFPPQAQQMIRYEAAKAEKLIKIYEVTSKNILYGPETEEMKVLVELFNEGYVTQPTLGVSIKLTKKGYKLATIGDMYEVMKYKKDLENTELVDDIVTKKMKNLELSNSEWTHKTRYLSLIFSIIAIIVSIIALLYKP